MEKGSRGHRLGGRNFHSLARHPTEAVREAKVRVVESRPAGQRVPGDEAKRLQCPAQAARPGRGRRNGILVGEGRLRAARSRCGQRPVEAAAWAKGKRGMEAALLWVAYRRKAGRGERGGRWPQPSSGKMLWLKSACAARRRAKMKVRREAVPGEPIALLLAWCAQVLGRCSGRRGRFGLA